MSRKRKYRCHVCNRQFFNKQICWNHVHEEHRVITYKKCANGHDLKWGTPCPVPPCGLEYDITKKRKKLSWKQIAKLTFKSKQKQNSKR